MGPLKYVVVTPQMHRLHHAADPALGATNLAVFFAFWDVLFGTFRDPATAPADYPIGLGGSYRPWRSFLGLGQKPMEPSGARPARADVGAAFEPSPRWRLCHVRSSARQRVVRAVRSVAVGARRHDAR